MIAPFSREHSGYTRICQIFLFVNRVVNVRREVVASRLTNTSTADHTRKGRKEIQKTVLFAGVGIGRARSWFQHNVRLCDVTRQIQKLLQVKEKFGELRFYVNRRTDEIREAKVKQEELKPMTPEELEAEADQPVAVLLCHEKRS